MSLFKRKIEHPWIALLIYFLLGGLLAKYGIRDGSLLMFDFFAGIIVYKLVTAPTE